MGMPSGSALSFDAPANAAPTPAAVVVRKLLLETEDMFLSLY